ncbi:SIR2-domain-containing protein [Hypoxylon sp. NC1633]|nr:SIR2-domain-containing protein [Hypoxylon sp. NC1633]
MNGKRPVGRPRKGLEPMKDSNLENGRASTHSTDSTDGTLDYPQPHPALVRVEVALKKQMEVYSRTAREDGLVENRDELRERLEDLQDSWENNSLFEDILEDSSGDRFFDGVDAVTPEEAVRYRQLLRAIGPQEFSRRTVDSGAITAKKLLTAFGIKPPAFLEGLADDTYFPLLTLALSRELSKRAKIMKYNSIDDAVALLKRSRNIVVLTGAGISTSLGIPDFRSKETGLYSQLSKLSLGVDDPQEVFNIVNFRQDPNIFFSIAKDILPDTKGLFTPTHAFIAKLQDMDKLLTNYSQNIDNLEANAGIRPEKLVQCHGSFATAVCQKCNYVVKGDTIFGDIKAGKIPRCAECIATLQKNPPKKRKRSKKQAGKKRGGKKPRRKNSYDDDDDDDEEYDVPEPGIMKPGITFFGEELPDEFSDRLTKHDRDIADLVITIGTSLKVAPVSEVVPFMPARVPQIYISRTPVDHHNFDIDLIGDCDVVVAELCRRAGWKLQHQMVRPEQKVDIQLEKGYESRHVFKVID